MKYKLLRGVGQCRTKFTQGTTTRWVPFLTLKEINLGITAEDARQTGGDRLFPLDIYTHTKSGRIRITDAQLVMDVLEMMGAGTAASAANIQVYELLTVSSGAVATNATYIVDTVSILDENGDPVTSFTASTSPNITGLGAVEGQKIKVYYDTADCTGIKTYALKVDDLPLYFELIQSARYVDPVDNTMKIFQVRVYRCRMVGNLEFTFRHGEFAAPVIEAEVLDPGRADGHVIEYAFGTQPAALEQS